MGYILETLHKFLRIYIWKVLRWLNRRLLKTYPLIEDCARCEDCGRNVHDFWVPDWLWIEVTGSPDGLLCYDCFCDRADRKLGTKWRMKLERQGWKWYNICDT